MAARSRRDALDNPNAQVTGDQSADELLGDDYVVAPLRRHALPPITDGAAAIVLAAGDRARDLCERPAWITGIDHRIETHALGARDLDHVAVDPPGGARAPACWTSATARRGHVDVAELHAPFAHQELILRDALRPGRRGGASTRRAGRWPPTRSWWPGCVRIGEAASRIMDGTRPRRAGPRHLGTVSAAEPGVRPGRRARGPADEGA